MTAASEEVDHPDDSAAAHHLGRHGDPRLEIGQGEETREEDEAAVEVERRAEGDARVRATRR